LLPVFAGPAMSAASWGGFGEYNDNGSHFRVWRAKTGYNLAEHDDLWVPSGSLPTGVTGVTGAEPALFGLDTTGKLVLLKQDQPPPIPPNISWDCPLLNTMPWYVQTTIPGHFSRLVVPANGGLSISPPMPTNNPVLRYASDAKGADCDNGIEPYEWQ
jgi:hypothetical protein